MLPLFPCPVSLLPSRRKSARLRPLSVAHARSDDRRHPLAGYVTVFLLALVTDRAFLLHQPRDVRALWETIYEPRHVAWQAEKYLDYDAERNRSDFFLLDLWCGLCIRHYLPPWPMDDKAVLPVAGRQHRVQLEIWTCPALGHSICKTIWFTAPA